MSETDPEADVRAAIRALLHDWVDDSPEATERFLSAVRPSFTGYGTGPGDYYADAGELREMVRREHAGMSHPFTLDVPWTTVHLLADDAAVAVGEIAVTIELPDETIVERPRFTFALRHEGDRWMLAHFHFSVPDAMQEDRGTMNDLLDTRTRQLQAEVERRTAELNAAVEELRAAQARLVQQEKMASLGQLTAGIAHEIKNPLNFVTNFAGLSVELVDELDETDDETERADLLADLRTNAEKIQRHGRRADAIVRAMMAHARSGGGDRRALAVDTLVAEYADLAWHGLKARRPHARVDLRRELGALGVEVEASPQEIGRVLINLLDNAFDAVGSRAEAEGPGFAPTVTVSTRPTDGGVEIRVVDNGPGVPEAERGRVFEPFYTTKPTGEGTGLGLSLAHDVVAQGHGGTLEVEDAEGEGAAFVVTLPRA
jgi:signal transduction histidine kinase